ncbi:translocation/assembly module TamB domain-containing protein [Actibacterium pelagium]|nr:translocation/assembly module TamB domain-containing protein [Actibacterium pelagium]
MIIALALGFAQPATAQDDDRTFLQGLIEDNLSGAGREVRIEGFEGALSSKATLKKLTIADDQGIWLTLQDATLDWSRSKLLSGRLEVKTLSAKSIDLPRLPKGGDAAADDSSDGFALPELPVAVQIDKIEATRVSLGAPVLGQAVVLSLDGTMQLEGGEGSSSLAITRLDRVGQIALEAAYGNETRNLALKLEVEEEEGGLLATLARLPGAPAINFRAEGEGPIDAYRAEISLSSDGEQRLGGFVGTSLLQDTGARQVSANLAGDMTPLFAPELRPFFGEDIGFDANVILNADGSVDVEAFDLRAAQMDLAGQAQLGADGMPKRFQVNGQIAGDGPVRLPVAGPPLLIDMATLKAGFDQDAGDVWSVAMDISGLSHESFSAEKLRLVGDGTLTQSPSAATARVTFDADGLTHVNEGLAQALGSAVSGLALVEWQSGAAPKLTRLDLTSGDTSVALTGAVALSVQPSGEVSGQLTAPDLTRFAALAGQPIAGALQATLTRATLSEAGDISVTMTASGQDLRSGVSAVDTLLRGKSELVFDGGFVGDTPLLRLLDLKTPQLTLLAEEAAGNSLSVQARLANLGLLAPGLPGAFSVQGTVTPENDTARIDLQAQGPGGMSVATQGQLAMDASSVDIGLTGTAPMAIANSFISPRTAEGTVAFDLAMQGAPGLEALRGTIRTVGARIADPLSYLVLQNVSAQADLSGAAMTLRASGDAQSGGRLELQGNLGLNAPMNGDLKIALSQLEISDGVLFDTSVNGDVSITGPLQGGAVIDGTLDLGPTEVRISSSTSGTAGPMPEIVHLNEPSDVRLTRQKAGLLKTGSSSGGVFGLNLLIRAPNQIFLRGNGLEAELGGRLRVTGTTADVVPIGRFDLLRGRLDLLGQRLNLVEGFATLQGSLDPFIRLVAETRANDITARATIEGLASDPALRFSSEPELPEDEVLAQLLFGRGMESLSPLQVAQLAAAVTGLAGGGGSSVLGRVREGFGLDDLDVRTDEAGTASVTAGKYLSDNIYTDVTVGSTGESEVNLNLDLTPNVTVKGGVTSSGDSNVGIYYQRDY